MSFFYGWASTVSRIQRHCMGRVLFKTKSPGVPGTNFVNFEGMKS